MLYIALHPIKQLGNTVQTGEELDLSEQEAAELLQLGAIELVHQPFSAGQLTLKNNH